MTYSESGIRTFSASAVMFVVTGQQTNESGSYTKRPFNSLGQHAAINVEYGFAVDITFPFKISHRPQHASYGMGGGVPEHFPLFLQPRHSTRHLEVVSELKRDSNKGISLYYKKMFVMQ